MSTLSIVPRHFSNVLLDYSLKLQFSEVKRFPFFSTEKIRKCLANNLLLFLGTSCSGKTTLSMILIKWYPRTIVLEHDERLRQVALEFFKEQARESFDIMFSLLGPSMLHYISCPQDDPFLKRSSDQLYPVMSHMAKLRLLCETHFKELHEKTYFSLIEDCKFFAALDFVVIVPVVGKRGLSHFIPFAPKTILFYSSFNTLASRINLRNQKAFETNQPLEMRYLSIVFEQFSKLFRVQAKDESKEVINLELIHAKQFTEQIVCYSEQVPFFSPRPLMIQEYLKSLFANLRAENTNTFNLTPSFNYSVCLLHQEL